MYTNTKVNCKVASAAQVYNSFLAERAAQAWRDNANLWHTIGKLDERDRCIRRAECFEVRALELASTL